jgi:hypothetical protein
MYIVSGIRCSLWPLRSMYSMIQRARYLVCRCSMQECSGCCYWSSFFDCASRLACSTLVLIDILSTSSPSSLRPSTCPMSPPGFGTGHSRFGDSFSSNWIFFMRSSLMTSLHVSSSGVLRLRRLLFCPVGSGASASVRGSTGHGIRCGAATTRKETMSVVVKSDVVMRDRG